MKKVVLVLILVALVLCVGRGVYALSACSLVDATVVEVSADEVVAVDGDGNEWAFFADGLAVGDNITLVMNNQHTASPLDDSVYNYF